VCALALPHPCAAGAQANVRDTPSQRRRFGRETINLGWNTNTAGDGGKTQITSMSLWHGATCTHWSLCIAATRSRLCIPGKPVKCTPSACKAQLPEALNSTSSPTAITNSMIAAVAHTPTGLASR
jgi:hypothetical protein